MVQGDDVTSAANERDSIFERTANGLCLPGQGASGQLRDHFAGARFLLGSKLFGCQENVAIDVECGAHASDVTTSNRSVNCVNVCGNLKSSHLQLHFNSWANPVSVSSFEPVQAPNSLPNRLGISTKIASGAASPMDFKGCYGDKFVLRLALARQLGNAYYLYPHGSSYRSLQIESRGHARPCGGDDDERADAAPENSGSPQHQMRQADRAGNGVAILHRHRFRVHGQIRDLPRRLHLREIHGGSDQAEYRRFTATRFRDGSGQRRSLFVGVGKRPTLNVERPTLNGSALLDVES